MTYLHARALKDKEKGKGYKFHGIRCNQSSNQVESAKNTFLTTNFTFLCHALTFNQPVSRWILIDKSTQLTQVSGKA